MTTPKQLPETADKPITTADVKAEFYAIKKYTEAIKTYAKGSSLNAVYENCKADYVAGYNDNEVAVKANEEEYRRQIGVVDDRLNEVIADRDYFNKQSNDLLSEVEKLREEKGECIDALKLVEMELTTVYKRIDVKCSNVLSIVRNVIYQHEGGDNE